MAKIKLNAASGGGSFSLQAPSSSSNNRVFTLPDSADATILTSTTTTGKILQVVSVTKTDTASNSTAANAIWNYDDSSLKVSITPASTSNKIFVSGVINVGLSQANGRAFMFLYKNGAVSANIGDADGSRTRATAGFAIFGVQQAYQLPFQYLDTPSNTNAHTYNIALRTGQTSTNTLYINRPHDQGNNQQHAYFASTITAMEVAG